jgi:hypothetical protein
VSERHNLAGSISAITRHRGPNDPRLPELRRDLAAEQLADYVTKIVAQAPPLSPEQRDRIANLLRPAADLGQGARSA